MPVAMRRPINAKRRPQPLNYYSIDAEYSSASIIVPYYLQSCTKHCLVAQGDLQLPPHSVIGSFSVVQLASMHAIARN